MVKHISYFIILFYLLEFLWILSGFLDIKLSLTLMWLPFLPIVIFLSFIKTLKFSFGYSNIQIMFVYLLTALVLISIFSLSLNILNENCVPTMFMVNSVILYVSVSLLALSIYILPYIKEGDLIKIFKVFLFINILDLIVSFFWLWSIEIIKFLPLSIFWLNDKYTVIGFSFLGKLHLRNPGIFESGATNANFLLNMSLLCLVLYYINNRFIYLLLFSLDQLILLTTFTRRFLAIDLLLLFIFFLFLFFIKKRHIYLFYINFILILVFSFILLKLDIILNLFRLDSFYERLQYWSENINNLLNNPIHIFYGFSLIQMFKDKIEKEIGYFSCMPITTIDNIYISSLMFGGIIVFILITIYLIMQLLVSFLLVVRKKFHKEKKYISLYLFLSTLGFIINGFAGNWIVNIQESILFWSLNSIVFLYLIQKKG